MKVTALNQLVEQSPGIWQSTGDDPNFALQLPAGGLRAGWHVVELQMRIGAGEAISPSIYPDYGNGISEATRIALTLALDDAGRGGQVVCFNEGVRSIRFDPATAPAVFELKRLELKRVTRMHAAWLMLRSLAARGEGWGSVLRRSLEELRGGFQGFAQWLHNDYCSANAGPANDYGGWLRLYDHQPPASAVPPRSGQSNEPLISVVMPVYNTPEKWLRKCIDSVIAQTYSNWELCIANDASTSRHVRIVLDEYARLDPRIRVLHRQVNGHISLSSNDALTMARGDYVALLDHDDELPARALFEVARAIDQNPLWKLIYSDEDKIDESGRRYDPYFKPEWNYDLFLGQNCVSHLGVYQTSLVRDVGGFRKGIEGSQDWDLALRCIERLASHEIGHIPQVLYHWRAIAGSTALGVGEKDYAGDAGLRAVRDHLGRIGCQAEVEMVGQGRVRVKRRLPVDPPRVSLIIPTRDKVELLRTCIGSILTRTDYPDYEVLIVDNQSVEPETLEYFSELAAEPRIRVLRYDKPFNYSAINNFAAARATGQILGLVNNDIEVETPGWLQEMVTQALRGDVGAVGAMLLYPNDTIQHAGVILGMHGVAGHVYAGLPRDHSGQMGRALLVQQMSAVTAACLLVRKTVFDEVGGLDERLCVAFNDIDFCLRVGAKGYRNLWTPHAVLYHHESASRGYEDTPEKQARFNGEIDLMRSRWGDQLLRDPSYNPNLSLGAGHFELAFPPRCYSRARADAH